MKFHIYHLYVGCTKFSTKKLSFEIQDGRHAHIW